jgi:hypothetical protein
MMKLLLGSVLLLALAPMVLAGRSRGRAAPRPPVHPPPASRPPVYRPLVPRPPTSRPPLLSPSVPSKKDSTKTVSVTSYAKLHGKKFSGGYYYKGAHHRHWKKTLYNAKWRTTLYFDPSTRGWYYWYATGKIYFPVRYMSVAIPTTEAADEPEKGQKALKTEDETPEAAIPDPVVPERPADR